MPGPSTVAPSANVAAATRSPPSGSFSAVPAAIVSAANDTPSVPAVSRAVSSSVPPSSTIVPALAASARPIASVPAPSFTSVPTKFVKFATSPTPFVTVRRAV